MPCTVPSATHAQALGDREWVVFSGGRYRFNSARPHRYDVSEFETALASAKRLPGPQALPHLQNAISAYGGDFLEGAATSEWVDVRRRELRTNYEMALGATGAILVNRPVPRGRADIRACRRP